MRKQAWQGWSLPRVTGLQLDAPGQVIQLAVTLSWCTVGHPGVLAAMGTGWPHSGDAVGQLLAH